MVSKWKQHVIENFDFCADVYDQNSDVQEMIAQSLIGDLPDLKAPDVLEIGCGTGALTGRIFKAYPNGRIHITDISPQMLNCARARLRGQDTAVWSVMDGEHPVCDKKYDLIIGNMVFQWFENLERSIEQLAHFLKPGGTLLYSLPAADSFPEWRASLADLSLSSGTLNYNEPPGVYRREDVPVSYESTFEFLRSMKKLGAHTPRAGYRPLSRTELLKACRQTDECSKGKITWRILYGRLQS